MAGEVDNKVDNDIELYKDLKTILLPTISIYYVQVHEGVFFTYFNKVNVEKEEEMFSSVSYRRYLPALISNSPRTLI